MSIVESGPGDGDFSGRFLEGPLQAPLIYPSEKGMKVLDRVFEHREDGSMVVTLTLLGSEGRNDEDEEVTISFGHYEELVRRHLWKLDNSGGFEEYPEQYQIYEDELGMLTALRDGFPRTAFRCRKL